MMATEHKIGDTVAIAKGHGFLGGSLGDVVRITELTCTIKLVCPWLHHGLQFQEVIGKHEDFEHHTMYEWEAKYKKAKQENTESKLDLLLRLVADKQYDDVIGRCAVELAIEIRKE